MLLPFGSFPRAMTVPVGPYMVKNSSTQCVAITLNALLLGLCTIPNKYLSGYIFTGNDHADSKNTYESIKAEISRKY